MHYEGFCKLLTDDVPKARQEGERYYLMNEELASFTSGEQRKPYARGLLLGMGAREFVPTAALLTLLAQTSSKKATLKDERTEWLFLCGRDIFAEGFTTETAEGFVLVQNGRDENLGLGRLSKNGKGERLLQNVLDRGNYLRHGKIVLTERHKKPHGKEKGQARKH